MINDEQRQAAEKALAYTFKDISLLDTALTHASIAPNRLDSNERQEFLGDSVLGLIVCRRIYDMFPDLLEGEMTKIKSTAVSRQTCAQIARSIGLDDLISLGKGMRTQRRLPQSIAAAVLESTIAAIYLDGGIEAANAFLHPHIDPLLDQAAQCGHQENFKSVLQQHCQQHLGLTPSYRVLDEKGPDHAKCFLVCVTLKNQQFTPCWGQSKKQAEQQAALNALIELNLITREDNGTLLVVNNLPHPNSTPPPCPPLPPPLPDDLSSTP